MTLRCVLSNLFKPARHRLLPDQAGLACDARILRPRRRLLCVAFTAVFRGLFLDGTALMCMGSGIWVRPYSWDEVLAADYGLSVCRALCSTLSCDV